MPLFFSCCSCLSLSSNCPFSSHHILVHVHHHHHPNVWWHCQMTLCTSSPTIVNHTKPGRVNVWSIKVVNVTEFITWHNFSCLFSCMNDVSNWWWMIVCCLCMCGCWIGYYNHKLLLTSWSEVHKLFFCGQGCGEVHCYFIWIVPKQECCLHCNAFFSQCVKFSLSDFIQTNLTFAKL